MKLLADVQHDNYWMIEIKDGRTYTLDLNGHKIDVKDPARLLLVVESGILTLQDSGNGGCIKMGGDGIRVEENGCFKFCSGKIEEKTGHEVHRGVITYGKTEITGEACIEYLSPGGDGIFYLGGELSISGNARILGRSFGITNGNGVMEDGDSIKISGTPYISGEERNGLDINFWNEHGWKTPVGYVEVSGGTFHGGNGCRAIDFDMGGHGLDIYGLKNYGTDKAPNYTFYSCSDRRPAIEGVGILTADSTVYVDICHHKADWIYYEQIPDTASHREICPHCGYSKETGCTYIWERAGMVYNGTCSCGSKIKVMLSGNGEYFYDGRAHCPDVSVILDGKQLNPADFAVAYTDNKNAGTAKAIVSGLNGRRFQCSAEFAVRKSAVFAKEGTLAVENGRAGEYRFDLKQLLPELMPGQEFGASPAAYRLEDVSLPDSYYAGKARIEGTKLVLPVLAAENDAEGVIGTVSIVITSQNFEDMTASVTVTAVKAEDTDSGDADSGDTDTNPVSPGAGYSGSGSYFSSAPALPFLKDRPQKAGWNVIRREAEKEPEGGILEIHMNGTSRMPGRMAETLRERGLTAVLYMGSAFSWSIDGKNTADGTIADTDLAVRRVYSAVPPKALDDAADGKYSAQLRLETEGSLGFDAVLIMQTGHISWTAAGGHSPGHDMNTSARRAGMYANLFYYNPAENKLEFADSGEIEKDGTVRLIFRKGSRYAVILSEQPMEDKVQGLENGMASDSSIAGSGKDESGSSASDSGTVPGSGEELSDSAGNAGSGEGLSDNGNGSDSGNGSGSGKNPGSSAGSAQTTVKSVKLSKTVFTYTGKAVQPSVKAIDTDGRRISSRYYTVTYKNNRKTGIASAAVTFRGKYKSAGTAKCSFTIRPAKPFIQKISKVPDGFAVKWKKAPQAGGYQIQYSADTGFQGNSTHSAFARKSSMVQRTVRNLKNTDGYSVRIRAYKTVKAGGKSRKIYSVWSAPVRLSKNF